MALYRHGKEITIHAGDKITVDTWDDSTNSQESGKDYKPGQEYAFKVTDVTGQREQHPAADLRSRSPGF